ncbi:hypothetical protein G6F27_009683 [Rhizopus arrhizus]|uniref:Major facilitator superfamily (MFS) profile domain-containing protein n=1 Tax=Rhizopus oryzae TaxID=64495 RepID=A0A9P7BUM0_RHIOR|nr:hypothetical protein G6F27_009683 [Rhizopus arrhizus]KAG1312168.1 hypothetical protein G6F64_003244 [Rhizopus arrhizus]
MKGFSINSHRFKAIIKKNQQASLDDVSTIVSDTQLTEDLSTVHSQEGENKLQYTFVQSGIVSDSDYMPEKEANEEGGFDLQVKEHPYRWVILFGGFLAQAISVMQDYYDRQVFKGSVDPILLNFVGTIGMSFCGLMGPVTPVLISLIGAKWLLFLATILITAGLILSSFAEQVWQLYITQSIIHGTGAALLYIVSMSISPQWFIKRRGLAMGIMVSGSGVGGLIMPFIMTHLNESLGGAWCYRVLVSSFSAVNVIGRVISGYLGDHIGVVNVNVVFLFICGLSSLLIWTFANTFTTLLIFILVYGFMSGSVFSLSDGTYYSGNHWDGKVPIRYYYSVSYCQSSDITAESVLIIALGQVWKCHWQSIFNQQPFLSSTVLQAIRNNVQQHIAEEGDLD